MTRAHRAVTVACVLLCIFECAVIWNVIRPALLEAIGVA